MDTKTLPPPHPAAQKVNTIVKVLASILSKRAGVGAECGVYEMKTPTFQQEFSALTIYFRRGGSGGKSNNITGEIYVN